MHCVSSWFLGIQSKKDPGHVMTEVYKALHSIGCTWYAVNNYRVICAWKSIAPNTSQSIFPYGRAAIPDLSGVPDRPYVPHVSGSFINCVCLLSLLNICRLILTNGISSLP